MIDLGVHEILKLNAPAEKLIIAAFWAAGEQYKFELQHQLKEAFPILLIKERENE